ncbi:hypothetical protein BSK47_18400, partial [Paenibacillus odorifer]
KMHPLELHRIYPGVFPMSILRGALHNTKIPFFILGRSRECNGRTISEVARLLDDQFLEKEKLELSEITIDFVGYFQNRSKEIMLKLGNWVLVWNFCSQLRFS